MEISKELWKELDALLVFVNKCRGEVPSFSISLQPLHTTSPQIDKLRKVMYNQK